MRVLLLGKDKITKTTLPEQVDGIFVLEYKLEQSKTTKSISIEGINNKWTINSCEEYTIYVDHKKVETATLDDYSYKIIEFEGSSEFLELYCSPTISNSIYYFSLTTEVITVGKSTECSIYYNSDLVQDVHASIVKKNNYWTVNAEDNDHHRVYLNNVRITSAPLRAGDVIFIYGLKIIWMNTFIQINNPLNALMFNKNQLTPYLVQSFEDNSQYKQDEDEESNIELFSPSDYFYHTPQLKHSVVEELVEIDAPPPGLEEDDSPWLLTIGSGLTMMASTMMSGYMVVYNITSKRQSIVSLIPSIVMFVAMMIGSLLLPSIAKRYYKKRALKAEKFREDKYCTYLGQKDDEIQTIMAKQSQLMRTGHKTLQECNVMVTTSSKSIWGRELDEDDFLTVRLGLGDCPPKLQIKAPEEHFVLYEDKLKQLVYNVVNKSRVIENVPITYSFLENKISAIISSCTYEQSFINGLILQLVTLHSPADLKLVFLLNESDMSKWEYAKFLPHTLNADRTVRFFADNAEDMKAVAHYLEEIYKTREEQEKAKQDMEQSEEDIAKDPTYKKFEQYYVIITNDFLATKSLPIINKILNSTANYGFSYLILNGAFQKLPNQCNAFIQLLEDKGCILKKDLNSQIIFNVEHDSSINMRNISANLLKVPIIEGNEISILPTMITFLEMFSISRIEQLNTLNRWKLHDSTTSLSTPIGVHTNGDLFNLDLHEKFHGPHGLIAGSTGSGKSEFIISFILSMAVNYHPDDVQFVLIDYKGGGLAGAFENRETKTKIPHLVGTITNLDTAEMNRTLVSIESELKKRQIAFNEARNIIGESTMDIYKYQKYYHSGLLKDPISHLFIICDEFAELKSQQPEFMDELISTARIGRALGVHLVLATQKPSGVVNDQIWSNSKFKICLKVQGRSDSMEVLKKPDAASLKEAGRFYLQVGYDEYFDIGQSAWSGAKYIPSDKIIRKTDESLSFINNIGNITKSIDNYVKKDTAEEKGDQLTNIVKYIINIAKKEKIVYRSLWLDSIPALIYIDDLKKKYNYTHQAFNLNPIIGEYDNPVEQQQGLVSLNLGNNTIIYGMSGSGKEDLLTTILYSTIINHTPEEVNFYIIDTGAETLQAFNSYPHVGDICFSEDKDKVIAVMVKAEKEIQRRKDLFANFSGNIKDYNQNSGKHEASMVIIINNYEVFCEEFPKIVELLTPLYRDGSNYGITFIITSTASNTLRQRVSEFFLNKICLQMVNDTDYRMLVNSPKKLVPSKYKGRGVVLIDKIGYEFQGAGICELSNKSKLIRETGVYLSQNYKTRAPRVPVVPKVVSIDIVKDLIKNANAMPIGYNCETKEVCSYDFTKNFTTQILSSNIKNYKPFIDALISEFELLPNIKIDYIDALNLFNKGSNNLLNSILNLNTELKKKDAQSPLNICIFTGLKELKAACANNLDAYNSIFNNLPTYANTRYIFVDNYDTYKETQIDSWHSKIVNNNYGIWLGEDVATQMAINFKNLSIDDRNIDLKTIGYANDNGKRILVKTVVISGGEDNEK